MAEEELLVSVRHQSSEVGVMRDLDCDLWLTSDVSLGGSTGITGNEPGREGLGDGLIVAGGALPVGASSCELIEQDGRRIRAECGRGAWVAVSSTDHFQPILVQFFDAAGETVPRPYPSEWKRSPVKDAHEPCPVCGEARWQRLTPTDETLGLEPFQLEVAAVTETVACCRCGFNIAIPVPVREPSSNQGIAHLDWVLSDRSAEDDAKAVHARTLSGLAHSAFQLYWVAGRAAFLSGWGGGPEGLTGMRLSDGRDARVTVISGDLDYGNPLEEPDEQLARRTFLDSIEGQKAYVPPPPERSDAASAVWWTVDSRRHVERAAATVVGRQTIPVAGEPVDWIVAQGRDEWAAIRSHEGTLIKVIGIGISIESVEVVPVSEPLREVSPLPEW